MRSGVMIVAGLALSLTASAALACSVTSEFVLKTNYEMAETADAIVVAVAEREIPGTDEEPGSVVFRIESALKGEPPAEVTMGWARFGEIEPSDPDSISGAHPQAFHGGCSRDTYERGRKYVLFLELGDGEGYEPMGWYARKFVFGRDSEDYAGPDSLWARTLRTYVAIQRNPDRMAALSDLASRLPALEGAGASPADRALADDIRDHLGSLSPDKPTAYLIAAYGTLERGETPPIPIRGPEANREGGAADAIADFVMGVRPPHFDEERQKESILMALVIGDHPDAAGLFERLTAGPADPEVLGYAIRHMAKNGQFRRAFERIETDGMRRMGGLPDEAAMQLAGSFGLAMQGADREDYRYGESEGAWRADPYVADRWPELALGLYWDAVRRSGEGHGFTEEIGTLRPGDYRARPEVTLALASGYDEAVEVWAMEEADRLIPTANWLEGDDLAWLPLQVLVTAFGDDRDAALVRAFCRKESGRIMVVQSLGLFGDELDSDLLMRMLVTPGQDEEAIDMVRKALAAIHGRHVRNLVSGSSEYDAIKGSLTGGEIAPYSNEPVPLDCAASGVMMGSQQE